MAQQDILSQDEIDALLHGVEGGKVETGNDPNLLDGQARDYDLASNERIVRGRMPTLEMINDRFARFLRTTIFNLLRRTAEISVGGVQTIKFSQYVHTLFLPTSLNLVRVRPLRGTGLVVFDPKRKFTISQKKLHQRVDYTPWEGLEVTGTPEVVYSRGKRVAEWAGTQMKPVGEIGRGKFVKREPLAAF